VGDTLTVPTCRRNTLERIVPATLARFLELIEQNVVYLSFRYRACRARPEFRVGALCSFLTLSWIVWICATAFTGHPSRLPIPFVVLLALYYKQLRAPYGIDVFEDGDISFVGLLNRTTVRGNEIISVKHHGELTFLSINQRRLVSGRIEIEYLRGYVRGKVLLLPPFAGFHEFLTELKQANPKIETVGC